MPVDRFSMAYYVGFPGTTKASPSVTSVNSKMTRGPIGAAGMIPTGIRRRYSVVVRGRSMAASSLPDELVHGQRIHVSFRPELDVFGPQALFDEPELPIQPNSTDVRGENLQADLFDQRFSRGPSE